MNISPLDENAKPVDWWFIYKVPKTKKDKNNDTATGYEYIYFDPKINKVIKSPNLLTTEKGALDNTLDSVFQKPDATTGWIIYNDEKVAGAKGKDSSRFGHTKGVIAFDTKSKTAFWLLHSWPKYVDPNSHKLPTPKYGQTFLCISLDLDTANKIANQMINHQEPQVFLPRTPSTLKKTDPLFLITQKVDPNAKGDSNVLSLKTKGGLDFKVIAKNRKWGKDFWNDLVGPTLKTDLDVETWIRGPIPSVKDSDGKHKVVDVKFINLQSLNIGANWEWKETKDHAKWGHSLTENWVCVGDINRMISQRKRGGGTIALQSKELWTALSKIDLIKKAPGVSKAKAKKLIKKTHEPVKKKAAKKKKAKSKKTTKSKK